MADLFISVDEVVDYVSLQQQQEGDEEQEQDADEDEDYDPSVQSSRVSEGAPSISNPVWADAVIDLENEVEEEGNKRRRNEGGGGGQACSPSGIDSSQGNERNWNEIDGLFCPICMDAWTNEGDHHLW